MPLARALEQRHHRDRLLFRHPAQPTGSRRPWFVTALCPRIGATAAQPWFRSNDPSRHGRANHLQPLRDEHLAEWPVAGERGQGGGMVGQGRSARRARKLGERRSSAAWRRVRCVWQCASSPGVVPPSFISSPLAPCCVGLSTAVEPQGAARAKLTRLAPGMRLMGRRASAATCGPSPASGSPDARPA